MEIFDYDNVLLLPRKCRVQSRSECDASVQLGGRSFRIPVVPANMKTVVDESICTWMAQNGYFYVTYILDPKTPQEKGSRLSRFQVGKDNRLVADPASEQILLTDDLPATNHNGGQGPGDGRVVPTCTGMTPPGGGSGSPVEGVGGGRGEDA